MTRPLSRKAAAASLERFEEKQAKVKISWWAIPDGGTRIRRQATMAGRWGWDATCSCGWDSATGGGVFKAVRRMVNDHKRNEHGLEAAL